MHEWLLVAKAEQKASLETIKCLKKNTKATGQPCPAQLVNLSLHPAKFLRNFASAQEKNRCWYHGSFEGVIAFFLHHYLFDFICFLVGGFNTFEKYARQNHFPGIGVKIKNIWVATTYVFVGVNPHQIPCLICFKPRHHALPTVTERSLIEVERLRTNRAKLTAGTPNSWWFGSNVSPFSDNPGGWDFQIPAVSFR